jgi:hypothetical protein
MKQQVARLSPHQNGKVFGVLMAVTSLLFILPFMLLFSAFGPSAGRPSLLMMLAMPMFYLVFGYVGVAIGCWIYNLAVPLIGGIEFDSRPDAG